MNELNRRAATAATVAGHVALVGTTIPLAFYLRSHGEGAVAIGWQLSPYPAGYLAALLARPVINPILPATATARSPIAGLALSATAAVAGAVLLHNTWHASAVGTLLGVIGVGTATALSRPEQPVRPVLGPAATAVAITVIPGLAWAAGEAAGNGREGVSGAFWLSAFALIGGIVVAAFSPRPSGVAAQPP